MTETVPNLELNELKLINENLSKLHNYLIDKDTKAELKEQEEKDLNAIASEEQSKVDFENEQLELLEKQELLESEIEFRENLLTHISELKTAINTLPENDFNFNNENLNNLPLINTQLQTLLDPVQPTEQDLIHASLSERADIGIILFVFAIVPVYLVVKFFSYIFNRWLVNIF